MADFNIQPVATQIRPVQGMTLGEMINTARGIQQYQQAQQLNPLELQKARAETEVSEQTVTPRIRRAGAEAITAETGAQSAQMKLANEQITGIANRLTPLINDLDVIAAEQNPQTHNNENLLKKVNQYIQEQGKSLGIPPEKVQELGAPYLQNAQQNPAQFRDFLKQKLLSTLDQGARVTTMGGVGVSTQPPQAAPRAAVPGAPAEPTGAGMNLIYPRRTGAQAYVPEPSEASDLAKGQEYRNRLVTAQTGLAQNRRNVEEVIQQANKIGQDLYFEKGGLPGKIEQKIRTAIGSAEYDMLAKDLANMALSNTQAIGGVGNTVAGLDMQQVANGTVKVPPEVLVKIARRVQADQTNLDMQANGAQAFSQKFGDNNMKAYQQAWNANADTKIFEAMNIIRDVSDPKQRESELNRLFPDAKKRQEFLVKYKNLKKLSETGEL
jgi:hypothetical protein